MLSAGSLFMIVLLCFFLIFLSFYDFLVTDILSLIDATDANEVELFFLIMVGSLLFNVDATMDFLLLVRSYLSILVLVDRLLCVF